MNKQHYIKPATTVFAVQPLDILAGSGTGNITVQGDVTNGDEEDVWEQVAPCSIGNNTTDKN